MTDRYPDGTYDISSFDHLKNAPANVGTTPSASARLAGFVAACAKHVTSLFRTAYRRLRYTQTQ